jgi:hypothetical protein
VYTENDDDGGDESNKDMFGDGIEGVTRGCTIKGVLKNILKSLTKKLMINDVAYL